jgi:hypothetical protein
LVFAEWRIKADPIQLNSASIVKIKGVKPQGIHGPCFKRQPAVGGMALPGKVKRDRYGGAINPAKGRVPWDRIVRFKRYRHFFTLVPVQNLWELSTFVECAYNPLEKEKQHQDHQKASGNNVRLRKAKVGPKAFVNGDKDDGACHWTGYRTLPTQDELRTSFAATMMLRKMVGLRYVR